MSRESMTSDRFNYRGLKIGLGGVALAMIGVALADHAPGPLPLVVVLAGIGTGFVGCAVHILDMVKQHGIRAEERRAWIRQHGDPDRRDDPMVK